MNKSLKTISELFFVFFKLSLLTVNIELRKQLMKYVCLQLFFTTDNHFSSKNVKYPLGAATV